MTTQAVTFSNLIKEIYPTLILASIIALIISVIIYKNSKRVRDWITK